MKVFMIGGTGLLGSAGAAELISRGHEVSSISLPPIPEGKSIPKEMKICLGNYLELSDEEIKTHMTGCDGFVFAAGVDERIEFPAPVYDAYVKYNIAPVDRLLSLAKECGVRRCVILGSYFSYFAKIWPEMRLCDKHPYIRSRIVQEKTALSYSDDDMDVMVLELPYIFGVQPGRKPVWVFLVERLKAMKITLYPKGGTTMITVKQAAQCIAGALEKGMAKTCYPVGCYNMTWVELLRIINKYMGSPKKKIITIPAFLFRMFGRKVMKEYARNGIEPGLDTVALAELMTARTFIDGSIIKQELGVTDDDIDSAIGDSVKLSMEIIDGKEKALEMKAE
ncbi:MAG: NAD-dependent epimerase/dehydratase family protein [Bacillota bacterium]|nr:NAD-dependent epimerase/dehydratase family protein [Bacillota bacterium]